MQIVLLTPAIKAAYPEAVCYKSTQKCGYEWYECGRVQKTVPEKYACPHKRCREVCGAKKIYVGKVCHQERAAHSRYKKHCEHTYNLKQECYEECGIVAALCVKHELLEYLKYCPKLRCEPVQIEGSETEPEVFVDFDSSSTDLPEAQSI